MVGHENKECFMAGRNQHVGPAGENGWQIKGAGAERATGYFDTQAEAIQRAREIARNQGSELFIHDRHGRIRDRDSHGNDTFPPRG
jgi:hypothetical protein